MLIDGHLLVRVEFGASRIKPDHCVTGANACRGTVGLTEAFLLRGEVQEIGIARVAETKRFTENL